MKKFIALIAFTLLAGGFLGAQAIQLGDFPVGKWLDANWGAYWEFTSGGIRIADADGKLFFDFGKATIQDYQIAPGTEGLVISFYCVETGKKYKITKPVSVTNLNLILEIDPKGWTVHYKVEMAKQ